MIPCDGPAAARAAAVLDEREGEGRAAQSAESVGTARRRRDRPTGLGRARLRRGTRLQQQAEPAVRPGGKREPAAGGQIDGAVLRERGDDGGGAAAGQRLFGRPQDVARTRGPHENEALHRQPERGEPGTVRPPRFRGGKRGLDPHDVAAMAGPRPARQRQGEPGRRAVMDRTGRRDLVEGAERKPAAKHDIERAYLERKRAGYFRRKNTPLQPGNALPKLLERAGSGRGHLRSRKLCSLLVL